MFTSRSYFLFVILAIGLLVVFITSITLGTVGIPISDVVQTLLGNSVSATWDIIIWDFRLPKAMTAVLVGCALSVSGLLMQTLFRNPMAGPYVLGLSSGASLGVALVVMSSGLLPYFFNSIYSITIAAFLGSLSVLMLILLASVRLKNSMAILLIGIMFSSFTSAFVSVLSYFTSAENLQRFTFWSMGSLSHVTGVDLMVLGIVVFSGLLVAVMSLKSLDALLLGENYAKSVGVHLMKNRILVIVATSILAGTTTAFVGPIAFVGLAVPHIARLIFQTNSHKVLFVASCLIGGIFMLGCDVISQLPGTTITLPINAVTSLLGAPVVIGLIWKKSNTV